MIFEAVARYLKALFQPSPLATDAHRRGSSPRRVTFRMTEFFLSRVRDDLIRSHAFAHERVGFITVRAAEGADGIVIIAEDYYPVADSEYLRDHSVGAMIGQEALRKALELALLKGVGVFHVHMHGLSHRLWFSTTDIREQNKFVPDFFKVCPQMPHGALVLDERSAAGRIWLSTDSVKTIDEFQIVSSPTSINRASTDGSTSFYV